MKTPFPVDAISPNPLASGPVSPTAELPEWQGRSSPRFHTRGLSLRRPLPLLTANHRQRGPAPDRAPAPTEDRRAGWRCAGCADSREGGGAQCPQGCGPHSRSAHLPRMCLRSVLFSAMVPGTAAPPARGSGSQQWRCENAGPPAALACVSSLGSVAQQPAGKDF